MAQNHVKYGTQAAGALRPNQISGLRGWWDLSAGGTITEASNEISQIDDRSGNGINATQGTGSFQPTLVTNQINGRPIADFDGSDDGMVLGSAGDFDFSAGATIIFVVEFPSFATETMISTFNSGNSSGYRIQLLTSGTGGNLLYRFGQQSQPAGNRLIGRQIAGNELSINTPYIITCRYNGGTSPTDISIYNYKTQIDTTSESLGSFTGVPSTGSNIIEWSKQGGNAAPNRFGEMMIWENQISIADRDQIIDSYLNPKWGITS